VAQPENIDCVASITPFEQAQEVVYRQQGAVSEELTEEFLEKFQKEYKFDINPDLTSNQRYE